MSSSSVFHTALLSDK